MSTETEQHPAQRRLFDHRVVVLGADYNDARHWAKVHPALKDVPEYVMVSARAHPGTFVGMRVATLFITPAANTAPDYDKVLSFLQRSATETIHLTGEGGQYGVL